MGLYQIESCNYFASNEINFYLKLTFSQNLKISFKFFKLLNAKC
jgi:hypothetical protein